MIFGLAELASFEDPEWRPATFEEVRKSGAKLSDLEITFLRDAPLRYNKCIHIGRQFIKSTADSIRLECKSYAAGSRPSFDPDGTVASVGDSGRWAARGFPSLFCDMDDIDRTQPGFLHIFVQVRTAKRARWGDGSLGTFLWEERCFPDAVVTCDSVRLDVHRAVLARNPVFRHGLSGQMVEARTAAFDIQDSEPGAVEALIRHIYTGETDAHKDILVPLLELAVQYQEPDLTCAVAQALAEVCVDTVQKHARALKLHREHPQVEGAYAVVLSRIAKDQDLLDRLV